MEIIVWLIMGGLIMGGLVGWVTSIIVGNSAQQGIVVGIVGALIGGWLIGPLLGAGSVTDGITINSFIVSLIGAVLLLGILNFLQRDTLR